MCTGQERASETGRQGSWHRKPPAASMRSVTVHALAPVTTPRSARVGQLGRVPRQGHKRGWPVFSSARSSCKAGGAGGPPKRRPTDKALRFSASPGAIANSNRGDTRATRPRQAPGNPKPVQFHGFQGIPDDATATANSPSDVARTLVFMNPSDWCHAKASCDHERPVWTTTMLTNLQQAGKVRMQGAPEPHCDWRPVPRLKREPQGGAGAVGWGRAGVG
jgi:hypothetical protein